MSSQLPNYLRAQRKRLALSQAEVAFLLGVASSAKVSRYECFGREPNLHNALAFEVIFQKSVSELFAGMYRATERKVVARARILLRRIAHQKASRANTRKRNLLSLIALPTVPKRS